MTTGTLKNIAVVTSGGDSPGMNAAVRAVVRTALYHGLNVYAIYEGYQGMVDGGESIRKMEWDSVGGMLHQGGTIIGSARCAAFYTHEGRLRAVRNLVEHGINGLVVIGGDGSLTGANIFRQEWPALLDELVQTSQIDAQAAQDHAHLAIAGLAGSIDNDMFGTDMTIGADTALHRITEAIDAITSTASSHRRAFVVEVMGRRCGYLALMSGVATAANWVFIPESPPEADDWREEMCQRLRAGRERGRRHSVVIVAEGARDKQGNPITANDIKQVLEERLAEDTRVTILGHVQRGGSPSVFDRYLGLVMGHGAVEELLAAKPEDEAKLIGIRQHDIVHSPLMESVQKTLQVAELIANQEYEQAMALRGGSFRNAWQILHTLMRASPHPPKPGQKRLRIAVMHSGAPAPGMNTAVRAAVRLGIDAGHTMLAVRNGFEGLIEGDIREMNWMSVSGWVSRGGAELGTNRHTPDGADYYLMARTIEAQHIDALLIIGGWTAYESAYDILTKRDSFPAFNIPIVCLPASINNDMPGTELSLGADTALNSIITNVDKIKESAVASSRVFVVEVMGRDSGYLALMAGMATGAERVYLPEEGVTLADLQADVESLCEGFEHGKRLGLMIRNEHADALYTTAFMRSLFEKEGGDLFDVRQAILGHVQQGGNPSPFDRIQATRLASECIRLLSTQAGQPNPIVVAVGLEAGKVNVMNMEDLPRMVEKHAQRPKDQWWLGLRLVANIMALPGLEK